MSKLEILLSILLPAMTEFSTRRTSPPQSVSEIDKLSEIVQEMYTLKGTYTILF